QHDRAVHVDVMLDLGRTDDLAATVAFPTRAHPGPRPIRRWARQGACDDAATRSIVAAHLPSRRILAGGPSRVSASSRHASLRCIFHAGAFSMLGSGPARSIETRHCGKARGTIPAL